MTFLLFIFALVNTFLKFSKGLSDAELKRRKSRFGSSSRYSTYSSQSEESAKFEHVNANINKDGDLDYTRGKKESRISFTPSLPFNTRKTNSMIYALSNFKRENPQIQEEIQDENLKPELPDAQLSIKVIPEMNTLKSTDIVASNLNSNYQSMKAAKSLSSFTPPRSSRIKKKDTVVVIDGKVERLESFTPSRSNRIKKKETVIEIDDVERHKSFTPPKKPSKNQFKV